MRREGENAHMMLHVFLAAAGSGDFEKRCPESGFRAPVDYGSVVKV